MASDLVAPGPNEPSDADKQDEEPESLDKVLIELKPSEVYKVPLTWLMKGSLIDVSLIKKLEDNI